jgi:hypothetical protein
MTVTKQQLERMASRIHKWDDSYLYAEFMTQPSANVVAYCFTDNPSGDTSFITRAEWYWERDKMQNRKEYEERAVMGNPKVAQAIIDAHNALKDLPHASIIMDAWTKGANEFMDSLSSGKPAHDNSWHERGEFPPVGCECEVFVSDENKWMHFEVIAIRDGHALGWCREGSCGFQSNDKSDFRQLRTEREKAIDEMLDAAHQKGSFISKDACEIIYDAGYRKVKP